MTRHVRAFVRGMGRAIDLGASQRIVRLNRSPAKVDRDALAADWQAVGRDMNLALNAFTSSHAESPRTTQAR